ncbi:MAG: holo-ACP synthase [Burkholderiales bacterium]|nr:MAG: holo-ACP synthase [Burkholderiales bacterium]
MIVGIGSDLVRIERVAQLHARYGERFARRVLGPDELVEYRRRRDRGAARDGAVGEARVVRFLANRFAAKEAYSKALGTGLRHPMSLLSLEVLNDRRGKPYCRPRKALAEHVATHRLRAHVSISDEVDHALAFVIIETEE